MTISLERFALSQKAILPIVFKWGQINGRKVYLDIEDGWYWVNLGGVAQLTRRASPLEIEKVLSQKSSLKGYALGNEVVPVNFANFSQRGIGETVEVNFLNLLPFEIAKIVQWEDGRWYFYEEEGNLNELRKAFNQEKPISNLKFITPEINYYWLLLNLQRQSFREFQELEKLKLSQAERDKRIKEFQNTFSGRLENTIEKAGGKLVRFIKYRSGYMVHWKIGNQIIKSTIRDNLRIINLGFCASGADKEHSMTSAVQLAKMFQEEAPLYLTRE